MNFVGQTYALVDKHTGEILAPIFGSLKAHEEWVKDNPISKETVFVCVTISYEFGK